ncbi:MAG: FAD:protein FMN transferase [Verrucomicrobia bacterium]|nr:FAD:protein FMN transferase [Verrucomicrobiota bacterium]
MATRFEMVLIGERPDALRAAGEEALDEIERLENALSLYRPQSDIARINAGAASGPVRIAPETFRLLEQARSLSDRTCKAFDVTAGPLIRAWGFHGGSGHLPEPEVLASARKASGWSRVVLDPTDGTVRFRDNLPGLLDLGAIGKGYALDRAAGILRDAGVGSALLHGGTSTVVALGAPPGEEHWTIALASAPSPDHPLATSGQAFDPIKPRAVALRNESLSASAVWGRAFRDAEGGMLGHVLDPRTGLPVTGVTFAAVILPSATESDSVSTALLVLGRSGIPGLTARFPGLRCWLDPADDTESSAKSGR